MDIASAAVSAENNLCPLVQPSEMPLRTTFSKDECLLGHYITPVKQKCVITVRELGYSPCADNPSLILVEQVSSLLAFKRWSDTPKAEVTIF